MRRDCCHRTIMPGSPVVQGGIFAVGLAVGVGAASLLLNKQQSRNITPTAVAVPAPVSVSDATVGGRPVAVAPVRDVPMVMGKGGPMMNSQVATEVFKYGFPGEFFLLRDHSSG